jgi:hypothetical protein
MKMPDGSADLSRTAHTTFRVIAAGFAVLLAAQCVWLLVPELIRPHIDHLPLDKTTAASAANERAAASRAARFGAIRGDLWAQSAFTRANVLWTDKEADTTSSVTEAVGYARTDLDRALTNSPLQSGAWLFLVDLALRFHLVGVIPSEPLKMSYYTGASDQRLMPLRLRISVRLAKFNDIEIRQFVGRDLRLLLADKKIPEIAEAYALASPAAKSFIEQTVQDIDPTALDRVRTAARKQSMPE